MALKIINWEQMNSWADYLLNEFQKIWNLEACCGGVADEHNLEIRMNFKFCETTETLRCNLENNSNTELNVL